MHGDTGRCPLEGSNTLSVCVMAGGAKNRRRRPRQQRATAAVHKGTVHEAAHCDPSTQSGAFLLASVVLAVVVGLFSIKTPTLPLAATKVQNNHIESHAVTAISEHVATTGRQDTAEHVGADGEQSTHVLAEAQRMSLESDLSPAAAWKELDQLYDAYDFAPEDNTTIGAPPRRVSRGRMTWEDVDHTANFSVLQGILSQSEVSKLREMLPQEFDEDADSVDEMSTYEFYLEKNGKFDGENLGTIVGKPDSNPAVRAARLPFRRNLASIFRPIVASRVTSFVNKDIASCRGQCEVCWSFVRRYVDGERKSHDMHFDVHSLVTVVISLGSYGIDFEGGLFVSTGNKRKFLALQQGDAVVHQSDLLHGVFVPRGERWSWVLWYKDGCDSNPEKWQGEAVKKGNPVALFLLSRRILFEHGQLTSVSRLLEVASSRGFHRSTNELGMIRKNAGDLSAARALLEIAAAGLDAEAMYNLGMMRIESGDTDMRSIVSLFAKSAARGNPLSQFNVGVAYLKGAGVTRNVTLARDWFARTGTKESYLALAKTYVEEVDVLTRADAERYKFWLARAASAGSQEARARLRSTSD